MNIRNKHHGSILALLLIFVLIGNLFWGSPAYGQEYSDMDTAETMSGYEGEASVQSEEAAETESESVSEDPGSGSEEIFETDDSTGAENDGTLDGTDIVQDGTDTPQNGTDATEADTGTASDAEKNGDASQGENLSADDDELIQTPDSTEEIEELQKDENTSDKGSTKADFDDGNELALTAGESETAEPFTMSVTFEGKKLENNKESNTSTAEWKNGQSKTAVVTVNRNTRVPVASGKKYILCMKVSDVFYFNCLPEAEKITGVEQVAMVQNPVPEINTSDGGRAALSNFSPYSGEIRLLLNPAVETITVTDIGISFNVALAGYVGGKQTIGNDPISFSLKEVEDSVSLEGTFTSDNAAERENCTVHSADITTGSLSSSGMRNTISTDGFNAISVNEQDVNLGKEDKITYACNTSGQSSQVYRNLKVVFHCPYITVGGTEYYLKFDSNDVALSENRQGTKKGYKMAATPVYDETAHTITYTFENVYLGGYNSLFITPQFSWPEDEAIKNRVLEGDEKYQIQGCGWDVEEQTSYTGAKATLMKNFSPNRYGYYIPQGVNIRINSSAEADDTLKIAKREIYQGLTIENGHTGNLGFFDIHNEGVTDSPDVTITFEFNTGTDDQAKYYVTRVNLPGYGNTAGTKVEYILEQVKTGEKVNGTYTYSQSGSFTCSAGELRANSSVDSTYYIKKLTYVTKLQKGKSYHIETAHLYRNRDADSGLFGGYMEGKLGTAAHAVMTVTSTDANVPVTSDGKTTISSTECSKVSADDYIAYKFNAISVGGGTTQRITAGNSATLKFTGDVSTEEYQYNGSKTVNGYHVLRDGIIYVALPEGVSISGQDQISVKVSGTDGNTVKAEQPTRLAGSVFTVGETRAYWWMFRVPGMNAAGGNTFEVSIQLATSETMQGIIWNFARCVAMRAEDQAISWGAAGSFNSAYDKNSDLAADSQPASVKALAKYFTSQDITEKLGLNLFNSSANRTLNISRAEAKLDVDTELTTEENKVQNTSAEISSADTGIDYQITVSSTDGGAAENFSYYIPIVKKGTKLDTAAMTTRAEFSLNLQSAVNIIDENAKDTEETIATPFKVFYAMEKDLDSTAIRGENVQWSETVENEKLKDVTAVKISTTSDAKVASGASYQFDIKLKYDNSGTDFDSMAGSIDGWKSFGRYTYTRNNTETTNTYPSNVNTVTLKYRSDMSSKPVTATLSTESGADDPVSVETTIGTTFARAQDLYIKKVEVSSGTQLIETDPEKLTGADANGKFQMKFKVNDGNEATLTAQNKASDQKWTIEAETKISFHISVKFSKALTDSLTERYVNITIGNDDVDLICQVRLIRNVAAVSAKGSGVAVGEHYQVPAVSGEGCSISANSAFTALYVAEGFCPGNYTSQVIRWKKADGDTSTSQAFPEGTRIIFMPLTGESKVESYWYYKVSGNSTSEIDLTRFTRMSGSETYTYDTSATTAATLRYLFVIDYEDTEMAEGNYKLAFGAKAGNDVQDPMQDIDLPVAVTKETQYGLTAAPKEESLEPETAVSYTVTGSEGNDSYTEGKTLALVLKPAEGTELPSDARIQADSQTYARNLDGTFIIPIGTIQGGSKTLKLLSDMFPDAKTAYSFTGQLYLAGSSEETAPMNGQTVGASATVTFEKAEKPEPALKVTGTRIASAKQWSQGQAIKIDIRELPEGAVLTATVYKGTAGNQKVTDILSSVDGRFTLENGTGIYDPSAKSTGKLVLSSTAEAGTYRLLFEIRDKTGKGMLSVPYYFIVQ